MKTLHLYLTRQVLVTLVMTVMVFAFVLLLGNVLKEVFALLVNRQASPEIVLRAVALLIPQVLVFALPMGMLAATLLVFGRFSADQELTATRASGISLVSLVMPILLLGLTLSGLCAVLNLRVSPQSRLAYKQLLHRFGAEQLSSFLTEDRFIHDIPNCILYVRKIKGSDWEDVRFYRLKDGEVSERVSAPTAHIDIDRQANKAFLTLTNATREFRRSDLRPVDETSTNAVASETQSKKWDSFFAEELPVDLDFTSGKQKVRPPKLGEMTFTQLRNEIQTLRAQGVDPTPALVKLHQQVSFSLGSFGFALIGIPLGIRAHRRETTVGIALALVLVLVYYGFILVGLALDTRPEFKPHLILWIPNFLFQFVGAFLLWQANRKG